jgi:hypothetical protein
MNDKENDSIVLNEEIDRMWNDIDNILKIPDDNEQQETCFIKIKRYIKKLKNNKKI